MINIVTVASRALSLAGCSEDAGSANAASPLIEGPAEANVASLVQPGSPAPLQRKDVEPAAATLVGVPDDALPGKELPAEQLHGRWTVERVAADADAPAGFSPDRSWLGQTLQIDDHAVGWLAPDGSVETATQCENPT